MFVKRGERIKNSCKQSQSWWRWKNKNDYKYCWQMKIENVDNDDANDESMGSSSGKCKKKCEKIAELIFTLRDWINLSPNNQLNW